MYRTIQVLWLLSCIPSSGNHWECAMRGACAILMYILCLSRTSVIFLNLCTGTITDHCQSAKDTDMYFKPHLNVNHLNPPAVDVIWTHNLLIDNPCHTTRTPPLLANFKALFHSMKSVWILKPSEDHFQLSTFPNTTFLAWNATSPQFLRWKSTRKSSTHVSVNSKWWSPDSLMIIAFK